MANPTRRMEIAPINVQMATRQARRDRSEAIWRLLQGIFGRNATSETPSLRIVDAEAQGCR
jgi:hypothetical protein